MPTTNFIYATCVESSHSHRSADGYLLCDTRAQYWEPRTSSQRLRAALMAQVRWALGQVKTTASAAKSVVTDKSTPRWARVVLIVCLGYLAMPIDLVPDFIPVLGWADDALVVLLMLWVIRRVQK